MSRARRWAPALVGAGLVVASMVAPAGAGFGATAAQRHPVRAPGMPVLVRDPAQYVDPLFATTNGDDDFPGADVPFGMVQWSPDTPSRPNGGGYEYNDSSIIGYSLDHLSGPGCAVMGDVPVLPTVGAIGTTPTATTEPFSHSAEKATPGYYSLDAGGITTELSTTTRAGIARFTFLPTSGANLLLKLADSATPDVLTTFQVVSDREVSGTVTTGFFCSSPELYTLYFDMVFDRPFSAAGTWSTTTTSGPSAGMARRRPLAVGHGPSTPVVGAAGAYLTFDTTSDPVVEAKVGVSYVSTADAVLNRVTEIPGWDFDAVARAAHRSWNAMLGRIQVGGGSVADRTKFYTALYHSLLHPNVVSDVNGEYMGYDDKVHTVAPGHAEYGNYSGWDIYRDEIPLEAVVAPAQTSDIVTSALDDYAQTGMLPKWALVNTETYIMVGDPADSIIAGAYAFGARDFDTASALSDMLAEAENTNNIRPALSQYEQGLIPLDSLGSCCNYYGPVSTQEEYNQADDAIAQFASALGDTTDAAAMESRANNWTNLFDPATGFVTPKWSTGQFEGGFDPTSSFGYVEADAYVYTAFEPQDLEGLIAAAGGPQKWSRYLDAMTKQLVNPGDTQIQLGNEPSLNIPWEYDYTGKPYKTQALVRRIQQTVYGDGPAALAGNDDLGAMSSWFVWSALGFYPETAGSATMALGSPLFPVAVVHTATGGTLTITGEGAGARRPYIQSMTLDGSPWNEAYLPATAIVDGGTIVDQLGSTPDTGWASSPSAAPPSNTVGLTPDLLYSTTGSSLATAGETLSVDLDVRALLGAQAVAWTASTPSGSGISVSQAAGTLDPTPGHDAVQPLSVTVSSSTPAGQYFLTVDATTTAGSIEPLVYEIDVL